VASTGMKLKAGHDHGKRSGEAIFWFDLGRKDFSS
jgi:hypothetical protein